MRAGTARLPLRGGAGGRSVDLSGEEAAGQGVEYERREMAVEHGVIYPTTGSRRSSGRARKPEGMGPLLARSC